MIIWFVVVVKKEKYGERRSTTQFSTTACNKDQLEGNCALLSSLVALLVACSL